MEFLEDEHRPRFLFLQGRGGVSSVSADADGAPKFNKIHAAACFSGAALLLLLAYLSLSGTQTLASLFLWAAVSLLLAPLAPLSATGGDIRVGLGDPLLDPEPSLATPDISEPKKRFPGRRSRFQKPDDPSPAPAAVPTVSATKDPVSNSGGGSAKEGDSKEDEAEEMEWSDADLELLKKQISKHPAGEPRRWEKIAETFRGRHGLDSVIRTAKSLPERKPATGDSFQQFLKQRKPVDKRVEAIDGDSKTETFTENGEESASWSPGDDLALLNALKAFPKDATMRWEKISAAVAGKSKAACMKRVTELKRDFRSSKA